MGRKISDIPCSNIFTDMSPRAKDIKERINKWDYIKFKSFCMAKENNSKMKRESAIWENIFANDTLGKGLISKIYKRTHTTQHQGDNNPIKKMGKGPEQALLQGGHTGAYRQIREYSTSLAIRQMQIKATMRYHFTLVTLAIIKTSTNNKCW